MATLILVGLMLLFVSIGGGLAWHSIGASAVAKHEQEVKIEQDKRDAIAKVKNEETEKKLIDMQAAYEQGQSEREVVEKKIYVKGQTIVQTLSAAARSADCVIPPAGMAILNGARGDLQNTTAADIFGFTEPASVTITPAKPATMPAQATPAAPVSVPAPSRPPKPVPVK